MFVLAPTGAPALAELGHPDVATDDTAFPRKVPGLACAANGKEPPHDYLVWGLFACAAGAAVFSGSALRVSTRTLSAAKQGEDGASG